MGNEQTKTELDERKEPITYFAINIKQPDKLHIVPSDTFLSTIVVKVLETHCRYLNFPFNPIFVGEWGGVDCIPPLQECSLLKSYRDRVNVKLNEILKDLESLGGDSPIQLKRNMKYMFQTSKASSFMN